MLADRGRLRALRMAIAARAPTLFDAPEPVSAFAQFLRERAA
jgi:hypothetical protein